LLPYYNSRINGVSKTPEALGYMLLFAAAGIASPYSDAVNIINREQNRGEL
jgi:hypothetical protein